MDAAMLTPRVDVVFGGGLVVGAEHTLAPRFTVGAELMGGLRGVTVTAESHRGACETVETQLVPRALVEGRVRADYWLTPWLTVGAYAGRDVMGAQASGGLTLGGHLRAFDGAR